jgi:hypothetical protein
MDRLSPGWLALTTREAQAWSDLRGKLAAYGKAEPAFAAAHRAALDAAIDRWRAVREEQNATIRRSAENA